MFTLASCTVPSPYRRFCIFATGNAENKGPHGRLSRTEMGGLYWVSSVCSNNTWAARLEINPWPLQVGATVPTARVFELWRKW